MMSKRLRRSALTSAIVYLLLAGQITQTLHAASTDISDIPIAVKNQVAPNIMMTLDDSGSMQWEFLPEEKMGLSIFIFPRPASIYGADDYSITVPNFDDNNVHNFFGRSAANNKMFYDPDVTYKPWVYSDGTPWPAANPAAAYYNPADTGKGSLDLTAQKTESAVWFDGGSPSQQTNYYCAPCYGNSTYWPVTYYNYKGSGSATDRSQYDRVQITTSTAPSATFTSPGANGRPQITRTRDEETQNFANWFQYYRSRILAARGGIGRAFASLGDTPRVGFASINTPSKTVDGLTSPGTIIAGVRAFAGSDRTAFFDSVYNLPIPALGTPLRQAYDDVGQYFSRSDSTGPWAATPGSVGGTQVTCRQNYHILTTDGYWNDNSARTAAARNNVDDTSWPTQVSAIDPTTGQSTSYTYNPANPWRDSWSNTLADVAKYYWVRDLRPDMPNNVFSNLNDNAFWQHLTTFAVALGLTGTIPKTIIDAAFGSPAPSITWPDPHSSDPAKIDDLAHAAINSRGGFFGASDPDQFASSLSLALENVSTRTASGAAVGIANGNIVVDNASFASSYLPGFTWSGELGSYPVNQATGMPSTTPTWLAQAQLDVRSAASRFIASYTGNAGTGQGIQFQPTTASTSTKLSAAQEALLNTPGALPGPADGTTVVEYLRGDRSRENTTVGYRKRNHLLGDIISAQPLVIRPPSANYIDSGYVAFKAAQATRPQIVLQGANDGMLHAFDAGTASSGATAGTPGNGAELWAYVPTFVLPNLNHSSRRIGYTHKYAVDGTPATEDVDFNKTVGASGSADWHTIAVGGLGKGGNGFYALDVTNTQATSEAETASKVLWEFPNSATSATDKANVGLSFGKPIITKTKAAGWVVIVTSGYNNGTDAGGSGGDGKGYLFVLDARTGNLIRALSTGAGSAGDPSGLAHISGYVEAGDIDNTIEYVYGGDLKGNVWRFDLTGASTSAWGVTKLATLIDSAGGLQPISSEPELTKTKINGEYKRFVYVGTGLLLGNSDIPGVPGANASASQTQTTYGLIDDLSVPGGSAAVISPLRANLQQQTLNTNADGTRTSTGNAVELTTQKGWYVDLPGVGERVNNAPSLANGALIFTSNLPSSDPCTLGGSSYFNVLDYQTGGLRQISVSSPSSTPFTTGLASAVVLMQLPSGTLVGLSRLSNAVTQAIAVPSSGPLGELKRKSWRELML